MINALVLIEIQKYTHTTINRKQQAIIVSVQQLMDQEIDRFESASEICAIERLTQNIFTSKFYLGNQAPRMKGQTPTLNTPHSNTQH